MVKGGGIASRYSEGLGVLPNDDGALESGNLAGSKGFRGGGESSSDGAWGLDSGRVSGLIIIIFVVFKCFVAFCTYLYLLEPWSPHVPLILKLI